MTIPKLFYDYPIRELAWPERAGKGRDAALPPPYSPC
ncbi:hypothetical protein ABIA43_006349 [Bradyrhizobium sp. USDA 328]